MGNDGILGLGRVLAVEIRRKGVEGREDGERDVEGVKGPMVTNCIGSVIF